MSDIAYRAAVKFFTRKGLNAVTTQNKFDNVYSDSASSCRTVAKWVSELKNLESDFEDAPPYSRSSTAFTVENI